MSYCRWSSDNWKCDLYCYADVMGGYTTHVATNRVVGEVPEAPFSLLMEGKHKEFLKAHKKQMDFLEKCKREKIGLPYDGESFNDRTLDDFLARLLHLREVGYNFPDYVIENLLDEIKGAKDEIKHIKKLNTGLGE